MLRVGVFVDEAPHVMARIADSVGLDLLQLHGDEPPEAIASLPRRALKSGAVGSDFRPEQALRYAGQAAGVLLDTKDAALPGGTGRAFDWSVLTGLRERLGYLVLAGGLTSCSQLTKHSTYWAGRILSRRIWSSCGISPE